MVGGVMKQGWGGGGGDRVEPSGGSRTHSYGQTHLWDGPRCATATPGTTLCLRPGTEGMVPPCMARPPPPQGQPGKGG